jgi:uncharacterized secreted protein with C-terminal beta-propeller domain
MRIKMPESVPQKNSEENELQTKLPVSPGRKILFLTGAIGMIALLLGGTFGFIEYKKRIKTPDVNISGNVNLIEELKKQGTVKQFQSLDEIKKFLKNNQTGSSSGGIMQKSMMMAPGATMRDSGETFGIDAVFENAITSTEQKVTGSDDYSQTNVQVAGVDEPDVVKTDGKYIYTLAGNKIVIVDAYPSDTAKTVAQLNFENAPSNFFVKDDKLVVFGNSYKVYSYDMMKDFLPRNNQFTYLQVYDIKDRENPKLATQYDFEGNYFDARLVGSEVYFFSMTYLYDNQERYPLPLVLKDQQPVDDITDTKNCARCADIYYIDMPYDSFTFANIAALNLDNLDQEVKVQSYMLPSDQKLYVSPENIYLTYTKNISEYELQLEVLREIVLQQMNDVERSTIDKIQNTDIDVLSKAEKIQKISLEVQRYRNSLSAVERRQLDIDVFEELESRYEDISRELEKTVIHKIAYKDGKLEYKNSGEVTGLVLNQFSMDESDGNFRIATTKSQRWNVSPMFFGIALENDFMGKQVQRTDESDNNLYVLDENMQVIGAVEKLAKGEKIYSVRFMQNRAYMVTFKQVDPLFVIDLKDPKDPKVLGELKIPGFSNYLHPYNDDLLIGIGKDTETNASGGVTTRGIKLSMFDVSVVSSPKEVDSFVLGDRGSDSIALNDHKAFLFSKEKNLLVIPVDVQTQSSIKRFNNSEETIIPRNFNGAAVFQVNETGFGLRGIIDHGNLNVTGAASSGVIGQQGMPYPYNYNARVKRSLYIDSTLYTVSDRYLKMNKIEDLAEQGMIDLQKSLANKSGVVAMKNCQTDNDCVVKNIGGSECGNFQCVNKNYEFPPLTSLPPMLDNGELDCINERTPLGCRCVDKQCVEK